MPATIGAVRGGGLAVSLLLAIPLVAGCDPAPPGPSWPPITLTRTDAGVVVHLPLCPGERAVSIEIAGPYIPSGDPNPPDLWDVENPKQPDASEFVLGDSSQFRTVRTPLVGDLPHELFISVGTTMSSTVYRWQNDFTLDKITAEANGGELADGKVIPSDQLAVSCSPSGASPSPS